MSSTSVSALTSTLENAIDRTIHFYRNYRALVLVLQHFRHAVVAHTITFNWEHLPSPFAPKIWSKLFGSIFSQENSTFPIFASREFPRERWNKFESRAAVHLTSSLDYRVINRVWCCAHLHTVSGDDLPGEAARQLDAQPRFSGPGSAQNHQKWHTRHRHLVAIDHRERGTGRMRRALLTTNVAHDPSRSRGETAARESRARFQNNEKRDDKVSSPWAVSSMLRA